MTFKFQIGDYVSHVLANRMPARKVTEDGKDAVRIRTPGLIVGRQYEECYGGGQTHYRVRFDMGPAYIISEPELELHKEDE